MISPSQIIMMSGRGAYFRDRFTDTDGTALASHAMDAGDGWTIGAGTWSITGNHVQKSATNGSHETAVADAGHTDYTLALSILVSATTNPGAVWRWQDNDNFWGIQIAGLTAVRIYERSAGGFTQRTANTAMSMTAGWVAVTIRVVGTAVTVFIDGVSVASYTTMTTGLSSTKCGMWGVNTGERWDNIRALADLTYINNDYLTFRTFQVFGDSITAGFGVSQGWPTRLENDNSGLDTINAAVSGDQALDQGEAAYLLNSSGPSLVMIGTNDQRTGGYGSDVTLRGIYVSAVTAIVTFQALPVKTLARNATASGTWANTGVYGGAMGRNSSTSGSTLTFTASGDAVYVGYTVQTGQTGTWKVTVDGVDRATGVTALGKATINGQVYGPCVLRIAGLGAGSHTVVFEVTNSGLCYCDWVAGIGDQTTMPDVYVGNVISPNATGFASFGVNEANVGNFNSALSTAISNLASDGIPVTFVDLHALSVSYQADGLHPNDSGQQQLADKFSAAIT